MESYMPGAEAVSVKDNPQRLNAFIEKNISFIKHCAYKTVGRFISESDDEYSIALNAFLEAVKTYDESKGSFSSFSQMVIKRRLIDYIRACQRRSPEIGVEPFLFDGEIDEDSESPLSFELREKSAAISEIKNPSFACGVTIRDEIDAASDMLSAYGFSFMELTKCSPTAIKTKKACAAAIGTLLDSEFLLMKLKSTRTLPIKELTAKSGISRKTLERYRRYIIAAALILDDDYPLLSEYLKPVKDLVNKFSD